MGLSIRRGDSIRLRAILEEYDDAVLEFEEALKMLDSCLEVRGDSGFICLEESEVILTVHVGNEIAITRHIPRDRGAKIGGNMIDLTRLIGLARQILP